jgi:hypothetical protein
MPEKDPQNTIDINYQKSEQYREVYCDGAVGSQTPPGSLWVGFYTERLPLPRIVRHEMIASPDSAELRIDPDKPGVVLEGKVGIVRNVEFGLYLSVPTARKLHEWLGSQIELMKGDGK